MLIKVARNYFTVCEISPLHVPVLSDSIVKPQGLSASPDAIHVASCQIKEARTKDGDLSSNDQVFDIEAEVKKHPDSLYVKVFAIKANEMNDNGDWFSTQELRKATSTFVGVPVFTNHQNSDINQARGKVVHSWYDPDRDGIMIIARVDSEAYPQLARGIKEEYIVGTSMGCKVAYSVCSICHHYAETPKDYCEHIRERKTRHISSRNVRCRFPEKGHGPCPICGSTKDDIKTFSVNHKAYEHNFGVEFIENSFVVNPACHSCGVTEVIDTSKFIAKVADISQRLPGLLKVASQQNLVCDDQKCVRYASQQDIDSLHQAMELLTDVSKNILDQKEKVDLEYLSDLAKVLADLQGVTDELTQQGFGQLSTTGAPSGGPAAGGGQSQFPPQSQGMTPVSPTPAPTSNVQAGPAGGAGTVTGPIASDIGYRMNKSAILQGTNRRSLDLARRLIRSVKDTDEKRCLALKLDMRKL